MYLNLYIALSCTLHLAASCPLCVPTPHPTTLKEHLTGLQRISFSSNEGCLLQKGETPLHYSAQLSKSKIKGNADIEIVKLLLEHGADCTAVTHQVRVNVFVISTKMCLVALIK